METIKTQSQAPWRQ